LDKFTPRERIKRAIEHKDIDRVPLDLGATTTTGIHYFALHNLKKFLNIEICNPEIISIYLQNAKVSEEVKKYLHIDTGFIQLRPSLKAKFDDIYFYDEWGIKLKKVTLPNNVIAYELNESPLRDASIKDLEKYSWPDPFEEGRVDGLKEEAEKLHDNTNYWIGGTIGTISGIFELACHLRGIDTFLMDLVMNKEFAKTLLEIITDVQIKKYLRFLDIVDNNIDKASYRDDLATQASTMMSAELYREMIKPFQKKLIYAIKAKNDKLKIFFHCCGSISNLLEDFIEVGIDVINPVQVTAKDMEPKVLKKRFGGRVCFWGAVDTQDLLRNANEEEIRSKVRELIKDLGADSGYVLSAVHNILHDIPPENIYAMYDEAYQFGGY